MHPLPKPKSFCECLLLVLLAGGALAAPPSPKPSDIPQKKSPMKIAHGSANGEYEDVLVAPQVIRSRAATEIPPKAPASGSPTSYYCPYGNEQRNSRLATPLPDGTWKEIWKTEVLADFPPRFVLQGGDRILIQAAVWQLFDPKGKTLAAERSGPAPILMDTANQLLYFFDGVGQLTAHKLGDGQLAFSTSANMADEGSYSLIARRGQKLLTAGSERQLDPHGHHRPENSKIEILDLGKPLEVSKTGSLLSVKTVGSLSLASNRILTAIQGETVIAAALDHIVATDWLFSRTALFTSTFKPLTMSVDETGAIYLVIRDGAGVALWRVNTQGERLYSVKLPKEMEDILTPPIVSHDHTAYLIAGNRLAAVSSQGVLLWEYKPANPIAGGVVTGDDHLLLAVGSEIISFDAEGHSRVLSSFKEEVLSTPPILTSQNELLVASPSALHCLKAQ